MVRKLTIAAAALIAVWAVALPTDASARRGGGSHGGGSRGGFHGGFHGGSHGGLAGRGGFHVGQAGRLHGGWRGHYGYRFPRFYGFPAFYYPYAYYPYAYPACYRSVRVKTRYGLRWHRVWVCG